MSLEHVNTFETVNRKLTSFYLKKYLLNVNAESAHICSVKQSPMEHENAVIR